MKTYSKEEIEKMVNERNFKRTLGDEPIFFKLLNFDLDKNTFPSMEYKGQEYIYFECLFTKGKNINQNVNGLLLLTFKGSQALIKEYSTYNKEQLNPHFYGYYNKYKNPIIKHISKVNAGENI